MNSLLTVFEGWQSIVDAPVWVVLLLKTTAILSAAWLAHVALRRANPRWRVVLWRVTAVGLIALPTMVWLFPPLEIRVQQSPTTKQAASILAESQVPSANQTMSTRSPIGSSSNLPDTRAALLLPMHQSEQPDTRIASALPQSRTLTPTPSKSSFVTWPALLLAVWLGGIAVLAFRLFIGHYRISRMVRSAKRPPQWVCDGNTRVAAAIGCQTKVELLQSADISSPFLCGLRRSLLLLPVRMCDDSYRSDLPAILAHELTHVRSHDVLWNVGLQLISIMLWFHPLVWRMRKAHLVACELVSDAVSASFVGDVTDYCRMLARVAVEVCASLPAGGIAMAQTSAIGRRLSALKARVFHLPLRRRSVLCFGFAALLAVSVLSAIQFASAAPEPPVSTQPTTPTDKSAESAGDAAGKVLEDVATAYKKMDTYKADGTVKMNMDTGSTKMDMETSFSISLKKPNLYRISWTLKNSMTPNVTQSGAAWSDGTQPYLYMDVMHAYSKIGSDEIALGGATGGSGGAAMTIASLFLSVFKQAQQTPFGRLIDPKIETAEKIDGEECYVVSGASILSQKETFWISKSRHVILKCSRSLAPPKDGFKMPEMTDKQLEEAIRGMGQKVTEENKKNMRERMAQSMKLMRTMKISGTSTETYRNISSPSLKKEDFTFVPPKDAVLKESLFGDFLSGKTPPPAKQPPPSGLPVGPRPVKKPATEPTPIPLHGTVVDVHGTPLAGATVLPLTRESPIYIVINGVARYLSQKALIALETRESRHGTLVFNSAVKKDNTKTTTDAQGRFLLEECPDGAFRLDYTTPLRIVTADGHTYDVNALVAKETIVHVPTLLNAEVKKVKNVAVGELGGVVVDEDGKPLEGVEVDVWDWYPGNETKTDRNGIFRLKGFSRDQKVEVRFRKPGYSPETFIELPTGVSGWVLVLGKKTFFEGIVRGPDGKPVPHALVRADQGPKCTLGPGGMFTSIWTETTSDATGHFRLYVQPDRYQFSITAPGVGVSQFSVAAIDYGYAPLYLDFIKLQPGVTFRAKIIDSQTNKPVEGVRLYSWQHKQFDGRSTADGIVTVTEMLPGDFQFQVEAKGYTRWWSESAQKQWQRKTIEGSRLPGEPNLHWQRNFDDLNFMLTPEMKPVKIVVERGVHIRGRVVDPDGKPVAGATVAPALTGTANSLTGDTRFSVTTAEGGNFDMLLPASNDAQYNLMAHDGKYQQWRNWANGVLPPIHTRPGKEINNVVLTLTRPGVVRGKVVDRRGNPLPYCDVQAQPVDKLENRYYDPTTTTKPDGSFELKFIRPGDQFIQAAPFWGNVEQAPAASMKRVTIEAGQITDVQRLISEKVN